MYQELGDDRGDAWARHNMAWASFLSGDFVQAEELLGQARAQFGRLGDRVGVNWAEGLRAYVTYFQRRFDEAEVLAQSVIADAKRWGDTWALLMMSTLLANMRLWSGRLAEAEQYAEKALVGFREAGDRYGIMNSLAPLNRARAGLGKFAEAKRGAEESMSLGHSFGELGLAVQSAAAVAMHLGDGDDACCWPTRCSNATARWVPRTTRRRSSARSRSARSAASTRRWPRSRTLEVDDFPFGRSARSLVRSLAGDPNGALDDADAVERHRRGELLRRRAGPGRRRPGRRSTSTAAEPGEHCRRVEALDLDRHLGRRRRVRRHRPPARRPVRDAGADAAPPDMSAPALREGWMRIVDAVPAA